MNVLTALYIYFGQVFISTVDSSCTVLRQYEYTPEGVCTLKEEEKYLKTEGREGGSREPPSGYATGVNMAKKCHRLTGPLFWPSMLSPLSFCSCLGSFDFVLSVYKANLCN